MSNKALYQDKEWLFNQYITLGKSAPEIGREYNISYYKIYKWLKKFEIPTRDRDKAQKEYHRQHPEAGKQHSKTLKDLYQEHPEIKNKISKSMMGKNKGIYLGENSPSWKGGVTKYVTIHNNVRKCKIKTGICEDCGLPENYDKEHGLGKLVLSNTTGKLIDDINNFRWVHIYCHRKYDRENKIFHEGLDKRKKEDKDD